MSDGIEVVSLRRERRRREEAATHEAEVAGLRGKVAELEAKLGHAMSSATLEPAKDPCRCLHRAVTVSEQAGTVACQHCGAELDPIQVLLWYANRERRFRSQVETAKEEHKALQVEIEALQRQRKNLRSQIRKAGAAPLGRWQMRPPSK